MKHLFRAFLYLLVLHLIGIPCGYGQTPVQLPAAYHYYVATTGNDYNPGTQAAPFRTIQKAIQKALFGQSVKVAEGEYSECILIQNKQIQLIGNPDNPGSVIINAHRKGRVVHMVSAQQTLLCGFTITGGVSSEKGGGIWLATSSRPILANLVITGNESGDAPAIAAATGTTPTIQNTIIHNNHSTNFDAQSCILHFQAGATMHHITVADNGPVQATVRGASLTLTIVNSILYNPFAQTETERVAISYSNIRGGAAGVGNLDVDPRFADPASGNYRIRGSSSCVDAGNPASGWNDLHLPPSLGTVRSDIGAYGWQAPAGNGTETSNMTVKYTYDDTGNQTTRTFLQVSRINRAAAQADTSGTFARKDLLHPENNNPQEDMLAGFKITIYPNPTRGALRVTVSGATIPRDTRISLYSAAGNLLKQWNQVSESNDMDIFDYPAGTYIMHIKLGEHTSAWKVIKN